MEILTDPNVWLSFATLTLLEIILGIDNIIFIALVTAKLPAEQQPRARAIGLGLAFVFRVILLAGIVWIIKLTGPLFTLFDVTISWRDLILIAGGVFLLAKATTEIHDTVEGEGDHTGPAKAPASFGMIIVQVGVIDMVFSIDSVLTAIGLADHLFVMVAAVGIAILVMFVAANPLSDFIQKHPTTKMLALSFLLLIGIALIADGLHFHIPRGYLYFAIAFSALVEGLNLTMRKRRKAKG